jgi:ubiquinone/menaquinone biosynthesis C-methylase UbiE
MFANCLTLIDSLPFFAECKRESYDLLAAGPGSRLLEVGCGLGDDAATLAKRVAPGGSVVAVDGSQAMVDAARQRHGDIAGLSFENADATQLPYEDATFDGCRIDRVLQHIADPAAAIREMVRVLRPGGVLVAFDNDWETMTTLVSSDLGVADRVFSFFATAEGLVHAGTISRADADRWMGELRAADTDGRFFTSYTGFLVAGNRPVHYDCRSDIPNTSMVLTGVIMITGMCRAVDL